MFSNYVFSAFFTFLFLTRIPVFIAIPGLTDPDSVQTQTFSPSPPATTIPAIPEQSADAACPLDLSEELFHGIKSACGSNSYPGGIHRTRCCPVLAAWLYSAYSKTALRRAAATTRIPKTTAFEMPVLPDDSETCVDSLEKAMANRGIELAKPNETCDLVYCYCGIRVHPLSCPEAFPVNSGGNLAGNERVKNLEENCLSNSAIGYSSLSGCSKCLKSLHLLGEVEARNTSKSDRTTKMVSKDCQLMGLTWLLNKNRSAYFHTVSGVLRALMMNTDDGSDPKSCTLNSDGMPLAVDSSQINDQSSSVILQISRSCCIVTLLLLYVILCAP